MQFSTEEYIQGILAGDISKISKALTLVESNSIKHQEQAQEIVKSCLKHSGNSIRIGISGMTGAGKSTTINILGEKLISKGSKVAVLAVDPSSSLTHGSILGDKTRMERLSHNKNAFIRPSPSAGSLGGIARKTKDLITIFEAAGYDKIIVETVGIGQSETEVSSITDIFVLLILPAGGDDLQGIKKGAVELADIIVINKADGDKQKQARITKSDYQNAMRIVGSHDKQVKVLEASALYDKGINELIEEIELNIKKRLNSGQLAQLRKDQDAKWFEKIFKDEIIRKVFSENISMIEKLEEEIYAGNLTIIQAVNKLIKRL